MRTLIVTVQLCTLSESSETRTYHFFFAWKNLNDRKKRPQTATYLNTKLNLRLQIKVYLCQIRVVNMCYQLTSMKKASILPPYATLLAFLFPPVRPQRLSFQRSDVGAGKKES